MENGCAGKIKKKKKEAEDMEQELLQEIASYWGTRAEGYSEVNEKELAGSQREAWLHVLEEQFPEKKKEEMKILDIGTGPGFFPMILSEVGYTVTAVDYTEEMLEKAKENLGKYTKYGLERVTLQRMDAQNLEFADETFDVVISRNLTWNLEKPEQAYQEWMRVLKPGGVLLNFDANWYGYLYDEEKKEAYEADRKKVEEQQLDDHYLCTDIDRMENIARQVPLSAMERPAWDTKVLESLGVCSIQTDSEIWKRVWSEEERLNYASTPMFLVRAEKNAEQSFQLGDVTVRRGEILSLLGENGSGKTTLMNMIAGIYYPDSGEIQVDEKPAEIRSPKDAYALGIGMVHQHFKLIDVFTAVENIALVMDQHEKYDLKAIRQKAREICDRYAFDIDLDQKVYEMSVSQKQTLEIIKMLYRGAQILILDEPTAVLTPQETEKLFRVMRNMRQDGKSIIIITHKLHEVLEISDRVAILRKGEYVGTVETAGASEASLTEMMVGKKVELNIERPEPVNPHLRLSVHNLSVTNAEGVRVLDNISFEAFSGEILGIAGISGNGQKELLEAIAGLQQTDPHSSVVYYPDDDRDSTAEQLIGKSPKDIRDMGVHLSFVPEDRLGMGLVGSMGMIDNMMLKSYGQGHSPIADRRAPRHLAEEIKDSLGVVTPSVTTPVSRLSGGNVLLLELLECLLGFGIEFLQLIQLFRLRLALLAQFVDGVLKLFPQSRQSGFRNRLPAYRALNARF